MKRNKKKKKNDRKLMVLTMLFVVSYAILRVFLISTLSKINYDVEKEKKEIATQEKTNESLSMAINELASLTKIEEVAKQQGLSYNNNNIKTVQDDK